MATIPAGDPKAGDGEPANPVEADQSRGLELVVRDHREASRLEAVVDGQVAFLQYERRPTGFVVLHTEVPEPLRRRGIGSQLAKVALQSARAEGLPVIARCPFVRAYLKKQHSEARSGNEIS